MRGRRREEGRKKGLTSDLGVLKIRGIWSGTGQYVIGKGEVERAAVRAAGKVPCLPESIQIWSQKLLKVLAKRSFPLPAKWQFELSCWVPFFSFSFASFRSVFALSRAKRTLLSDLILPRPPKGGSLCACFSTWARKRARAPEGERKGDSYGMKSKKQLISNCAAKFRYPVRVWIKWNKL